MEFLDKTSTEWYKPTVRVTDDARVKHEIGTRK